MRKFGKSFRDRQTFGEKKYDMEEMRVSCPITKARIQTHTH